MSHLRVAGAQLDLTVGDLAGNVAAITAAMDRAEAEAVDVLLLPELAVTGYPPEDLLLRQDFVADNLAALDEIASRSGKTVTVVGFVDWSLGEGGRGSDGAGRRGISNAAALVCGGRVVGRYHKQLLPNYGVFDEQRYFEPGPPAPTVWLIGDVAVGVSVCEDMWVADGPPTDQAQAGAAVLLNINGSPFHAGKTRDREALVTDQARRSGVPVVYLNLVGGQDELVFDGDSLVVDAAGKIVHRSPQFAEDFFVVDVPVDAHPVPAGAIEVAPARERPAPRPIPAVAEPMDDLSSMYAALTTGLGDYVRKNGFTGVVVGLSGGIDSALTAAVAVDALGSDAVHGVTMPTRYSSRGSIDDSLELGRRLGIQVDTVPIDDLFAGYLDALEDLFAGTEHGVAEENIQSRVRGTVLMAISNKFGSMVVATGNKSEMAVGYATLYGDMAGGYAVLKDVFKTEVYALARWRNREEEVIPRSIIDKPPSAELRPDQLDTDSLPPYDVLDAILELYVEGDASRRAIVASGFAPELVDRVTAMVDRNEYKRRQSAPGVKISTKAFGRDRRLPITNGYR